MADVPLVPTSLAMVSVEAFLYGIFLVLSCLSLYLLQRRLRLINPHVSTLRTLCHPMLMAGSVVWITVTAHWVLIVYRSFVAFVYFKGGTEPLEFYGNLSQTSEVLKIAFLISALLTFDVVMVWRVWIIWNTSIFAVFFPLASFLGCVVCGIATVYEFSQFTPGETPFSSAGGRWITGSCVFTLCTNLSSCALITYKLWHARSTIKSHGTDMQKVVSILVESASLYVGWTILYMIVYLSQSNLEDAVFDSWSPIAGIGFMLINVRVGAGWSVDTDRQSLSSHRASSRYPVSPVAVSVTRVVDHDMDLESNVSDVKMKTLNEDSQSA